MVIPFRPDDVATNDAAYRSRRQSVFRAAKLVAGRLLHVAQDDDATGPLSDLPGYDFAIQALSGLMSITGPVAGPPCKAGVAVTDVLTGLYAAVAVLACLHARSRSGHGYAIDLALLDCAVAGQVNLVQAYLSSGTVPPRQGNAL